MDVEILVMANSQKLGGRCLAGLKADDASWIRPVSETEHGEIPLRGVQTPEGVLRPLDVISCDLIRPAPRIHQSENWVVRPGSIRLIRRMSVAHATPLIERSMGAAPYFLDGPRRYVAAPYFWRRTSPLPSLAAVKVASVQLESTPRPQRGDIGVRVQFEYQGQAWNLPLTDDFFTLSSPRQTLGPSYLCLSLGDLFPLKNNHYKLIAGIVPLET